MFLKNLIGKNDFCIRYQGLLNIPMILFSSFIQKLKCIYMNKLFYILFFITLIVAGCGNNQENEIRSKSEVDQSVQPTDDISIKSDSVERGDIFVTTGPAGRMDQKQGRIIIFTDSGKTLPIKMEDNVLLAQIDSTGTSYRVRINGDQTVLVLPNSDKVLKDGRMMFITDNGERMKVKMLGEKMVVITAQNTMLPLEKLE